MTETTHVLERLVTRGVLQPHGTAASMALSLAADLFSKSAAITKINAVENMLKALRAVGLEGLRNAEIQSISGMSRSQVKRIMNDLQAQGRVNQKGRG